MRPHIINALGLACLILAGGCFLAVIFGIIEAIVTAALEGRRRPMARKARR